MKLFSPLTLGTLELPNRVVMAPMTRTRADEAGVPGALMAQHYAQRASLGLIVTEGVYPGRTGQGYPRQPGLANEAQVAGWSRVAQAVHAQDGRIFAQLMHAGRFSHPSLIGGALPVGPSPTAIEGATHTYQGKQAFVIPHALTEDEIPVVVNEFVLAARNAMAAGLDGVEIHGANGYLLHQFLDGETNRRTDGWGGTPHNQARLAVEVTSAVAEAIGAGRVGLRISPAHQVLGIGESDPAGVTATYNAVVEALAPLDLAYLSILHHDPAGDLVQELRRRFDGPVMLNTGMAQVTGRDQAETLVADGHAEAVVVGRQVIANPDLVRRWANNLPLNPLHPATFYTEGATGYTDYPALAN